MDENKPSDLITVKDGITRQELFQWIEATRHQFIEESASGVAPIMTRVMRGSRSFYVVVSQNLNFWRTFSEGSWEPFTTAIFDRILSSETTFVDIGAWIGPTTLYAAQTARRTIALEPDPLAFRELSVNICANDTEEWCDRIELINAAASPTKGTVVLGTRSHLGDSMSSTLLADSGESWTAKAVSLFDLLQDEYRTKRPIFLKIDIEGGEFDLVPSLSPLFGHPQVVVLLSLHPVFLNHALKSKGIRNRWLRHAIVSWEVLKTLLALKPLSLHTVEGKRTSSVRITFGYLRRKIAPSEVLAVPKTVTRF